MPDWLVIWVHRAMGISVYVRSDAKHKTSSSDLNTYLLSLDGLETYYESHGQLINSVTHR